jgi:hypothetical protein
MVFIAVGAPDQRRLVDIGHASESKFLDQTNGGDVARVDRGHELLHASLNQPANDTLTSLIRIAAAPSRNKGKISQIGRRVRTDGDLNLRNVFAARLFAREPIQPLFSAIRRAPGSQLPVTFL